LRASRGRPETRDGRPDGAKIRLSGLASPGPSNGRRALIDRAFAAHGLTPNVVAETDALSSELLTVKTGVAHRLLPVANRKNFLDQGLAQPLPIDADLFLTCSIISSSDSRSTELAKRFASC
jgi:hypothetical protein